MAFYQATGGENWKLNRRWLSDSPLDQWQGVATNQEGAVTRLILPDNRLTGEIPPAFENLRALAELDLAGNQLTGEIPPGFGNLLALTGLDLSGNQLNGCLPVALYYDGRLALPGSKVEIEPITACPDADRENLAAVFEAMGLQEHSGPIGTWPGVWVDQSGYVKALDLLYPSVPFAPSLYPEVPVVVELTRLSRLQALRLQATGELPPELGKLSNLQHLRVREGVSGGVTGEIPPELGNLSNLTHLDLFGNLSGEIPAELGRLSNLTRLNLNQSQGEMRRGMG